MDKKKVAELISDIRSKLLELDSEIKKEEVKIVEE